MSSGHRTKENLTDAPECRSLRWDRSTWHRYEPVDGKVAHVGSYVERCAKCGKERVIEVEG